MKYKDRSGHFISDGRMIALGQLSAMSLGRIEYAEWSLLSVRAKRVFQRVGITHYSQICPSELMEQKNFGVSTLVEVQKWYERHTGRALR